MKSCKIRILNVTNNADSRAYDDILYVDEVIRDEIENLIEKYTSRIFVMYINIDVQAKL